jgi:hypothetical protein
LLYPLKVLVDVSFVGSSILRNLLSFHFIPSLSGHCPVGSQRLTE